MSASPTASGSMMSSQSGMSSMSGSMNSHRKGHSMTTGMNSMTSGLLPSSVSMSDNTQSTGAAVAVRHADSAFAALVAVGAGVAYVL